jgi:YVTN family beta-propeller protein
MTDDKTANLVEQPELVSLQLPGLIVGPDWLAQYLNHPALCLLDVRLRDSYDEGQNLWLGLRDPDTDQVEVIALDLDTLEITSRLDLGQDTMTLYIGKATSTGMLHVGKMGSGQVVTIDTKAFEVRETWDVPTNGDVVCDADIAVGADGLERFYYPTRKGDTLVSLNAETGETSKIVDTPAGSTPLMLTTAPDNTVWVQETDSNTNAVFDPVTLELKQRFLTGEGPIVASFSADGKYGYIGHGRDTIVTVVDTQTLEEVQRIEVGTNPQKLAIHENGRSVYAILTKEAAVAVIDTGSWEVTERIDLGTNPTGIYFQADSS